MASLKNTKPGRDRALARLRLDARLEPLRPNLGAMTVPRGGWLRSIRNALGMSLDDVADRLDVTRSTASRVEASEQRGTIQLDTLRRAAEALNCELVYALVPKLPLESAVEQERARLARQLNAKVQTHMSLEGQDTHDTSLDAWRLDRATTSISDRQLWKKAK
ncbi:MAG: hypothetical protein A3E01_00440 [Gammaproteobacteria bacterium RIFCSPHIGHO2_12_FULL_63_22]|nr:MAG: hypothetical protein A3E01_00440 [Gammaproteobacteria bacterium RIFCSPHIGHO2_12_FULL_63_22]